MADFLSPLWEFLFEELGIFGLMIATASPIIFVFIIIILIAVIVKIIKKAKAAGVQKLRKKALALEESGNYEEAYSLWMQVNKKEPLRADEEYIVGLICKKGNESGWGPEEDETCAGYWFKKASDKGHVQSLYELGRLLADGADEHPLDSAQGMNMIRKAAQEGCTDAKAYIENSDKLLKELLYDTGYRPSYTAAAMGHAPSQFGLCIELMEKDIKTAMEWGKLAAQQGHEKAQNVVGTVYAFGHGVKPDVKYGMEMLEKSARQGSADSQCKLGYLYRGERGVKRDDDKAIFWFEMAHKQGVADATYSLGLIYGLQSHELRERKGLTKLDALDDKEVMRLFYRSHSLIMEAADAGSEDAKKFLS